MQLFSIIVSFALNTGSFTIDIATINFWRNHNKEKPLASNNFGFLEQIPTPKKNTFGQKQK